MKVSIINGSAGDDTVIVDGVAVNFDLSPYLPDQNIWAIQWDGTTGEVEYSDGRHNEVITDLSPYQGVLDAYTESLLPPVKTPAELLEELETQERNWRDNELTSIVDPKQLVLVWAGMTTEEQLSITNYRQLLLDYPQEVDFPNGTRPTYELSN